MNANSALSPGGGPEFPSRPFASAAAAREPMADLTAQELSLLALGQRLREMGYRFVTVTPATHGRVNARPQNRWARSLEDVFGWSRPFRAALLPAPILELMQAAGVARPEGDGWRSLLRVSTLENEVLFHSAFPTAGADAVFFGPDTYRFAAAITAQLAQRRGPLRRAVDIGCGSGAGGILIARAAPSARIVLGDINPAALRMARINATLAGLDNIEVRHSDLLAGVEGEFDLIVANPPYLVDPARRSYRHGGGELGAALSLAIAEQASARLAPGGTLLLYTGAAIVDGADAFRRALAPILADRALDVAYREIDPDVFGEELEGGAYARADRIAAVLLTVTKSR
jgi:release factor glutamine methyltransferase